MIPKDLALYSVERGRAVSDRLLKRAHGRYVDYAAALLRLYRESAGKTREALHREAQSVFRGEPDCPPRRIRALIRLLDRASEFETDVNGRAFQLRRQVFSAAAQTHPLVGVPDTLFQHAEREVKKRIAAEIGMTWPQLESALYADHPAFHRLKGFDGYAEPEELLADYNICQAQALLYWAQEAVVTAREDFRRIFRHVKFNRLLHEVETAGDGGYRIRLTGPASLLTRTRRYGVDMARFLPGLLACRGWTMSARLRLPSGLAVFSLCPRDGLTGRLPPTPEFDSKIEMRFAQDFGESNGGWTLIREGVILVRGQKAFVPDFVLRHESGRRVYLEIAAYWTPEYLERKAATLAHFAGEPILIAAAETIDTALARLPFPRVPFKRRLRPEAVIKGIESFLMRSGESGNSKLQITNDE
jgi:hypothetical protein